jgi:phosphoglycolate phosphatase-like HAD superfamily hydrolase
VHVVWDWNGTLLDDLDQVVAAVNVTLEALGEPPIDVPAYGAHYQRPVRRFYESLLNRRVDGAEWEYIDEVFHKAYRELVPTITLAADAFEALEAVDTAGHTQSLLSMLSHDDLVNMASTFGISRFMRRVDGLRGERGVRKQASLERHLEVLGLEADQAVLIGDALDDVDAARATGTSCVMYDRGTFPREHVTRTGVRTAGTLVGALAAGGVI